jgi:hypothetical protein
MGKFNQVFLADIKYIGEAKHGSRRGFLKTTEFVYLRGGEGRGWGGGGGLRGMYYS